MITSFAACQRDNEFKPVRPKVDIIISLTRDLLTLNETMP